MWRTLPQQGATIKKLQVLGANELVIVPTSGERLRLASRGTVSIEVAGAVQVRSEAEANGMRVTFAAEPLILERAEVAFDGEEREWEALWRRARARSRPWWREGDADEIDLDWVLEVTLHLRGTAGARRTSRPPPAPSSAPAR